MANKGWTKFDPDLQVQMEEKKDKDVTTTSSSSSKHRDRDHNGSGGGASSSNVNNNNNTMSNTITRITKTNYNGLEELRRGTTLLKYPQHFEGSPHFKYFQLSSDNLRIQWFSTAKALNTTCVYIKDIKDIIHGQETEAFKKQVRNRNIEKACFSIIYDNNVDGMTSLDLGAKSLDEASLWVRVLTRLKKIYEENGANDENLTKLDYLDVGIHFFDRNRPLSKFPNGQQIFIRGNSSSQIRNVDPQLLKHINKDYEILIKQYKKVYKLSLRLHGSSLDEHGYIPLVLSELEERLQELHNEILNTRDTDLTKRDVWRFGVDLNALEEKILTLIHAGGLANWKDKLCGMY